ncbi:MAG: type IV secretory system conjugative DNA transfer family protein [Actinomycetota bacterium]
MALLAFHEGGPSAEPGGPLIRWLTDPLASYRQLVEWTKGPLPSVGGILVGLVALGAAAYVLGLRLRRLRERKEASGGRLLRILPPPDVDADGAITLWMALHALIRPRWKRLVFGQPHVAWELSADGGDADLAVWVPRSVPPGLVERAIESAWPGARVVENDPRSESGESDAASCELVLGEPDYFPLGEGSGTNPLRVVLGALTLLAPGEKAVAQILARPVTFSARHRMRSLAVGIRRRRNSHLLKPGARPGRPNPDPAADQDVRAVLAKAASPLWEVVLRLSVSSPDGEAARGKIHALAGAFGVFEGRNGFRRRRMRGGLSVLARRSMRGGFLLGAHELASLATLPTPAALPALERAAARTVAAPRGLPKTGRPLGRSDHPGHVRPVALSVDDGRHHIHLMGETGTGKSTLIARMALADAEAGRAAVVIDPKGDLVASILDRLPKGAPTRTCLLNPEDPETSVGLNMLAGDDPDLVVDQIVSVFRRIYEHAWGPRTDDIMRAACLTLIETPGTTLAEVTLLLTNREVRNAVRYRRRHYAGMGDLGNFWDWYERLGEQQRAANIAPLMNKLRAFLLRGPVRAMIGQSRPRLDVGRLLDSGGLLLVRIPKGTLGEETSRILGAFVVARVWQAAMKRAESKETARSSVSLYVDEMHNYLALPRSFEDMLAEARGYGLSLCLAHQHLGQLPREMRLALGANARTKITFACSPDDAGALEGFFSPHLSDHDLSHLAPFQAACRPCIDGGRGPAFTFRTEPLPASVPGRAEEVAAASARAFAVPRMRVEAQIRNRHSQLLSHSLGQSTGQSVRQPRSAGARQPDQAGERPIG